MNLKFLPIGTVCLVNSISKKQMIIGYSKSGYDYIAVEYPKGFESDMKLSYFNHDEVRELYSLGYKNEESRIFNGTLASVLTSNILDEEDAKDSESELEESLVMPFEPSESVEEKTEVLTSDSPSLTVFHEPKTEELPILKEDEEAIIETQIDKLPELEEVSEIVENDFSAVPYEIQKVKLEEDGTIVSGGVRIGKILKTTDRLRGIIMAEEEEEKEEPIENVSDDYPEVPSEKIEELSLENKVEEVPTFMDDVSTEFVNGLEELENEEKEEQTFPNVTDIEVDNDLPLDDETVDISTMVKKIEETMSEREEDDEPQKKKPKKKKKKEKWGLFHFGKK